jgi:hypothetical protein
MTSKKPTPKKQEPPTEQQPTSGDPDLPLAAPPPSIEDRVAALELANIELEKRIKKHEEIHFGKESS